MVKTIEYATPVGKAQVSFSLVRDTTGIVRSISVSKVSGDATSTAYIEMFSDAISSAIV